MIFTCVGCHYVFLDVFEICPIIEFMYLSHLVKQYYRQRLGPWHPFRVTDSISVLNNYSPRFKAQVYRPAN